MSRAVCLVWTNLRTTSRYPQATTFPSRIEPIWHKGVSKMTASWVRGRWSRVKLLELEFKRRWSVEIQAIARSFRVRGRIVALQIQIGWTRSMREEALLASTSRLGRTYSRTGDQTQDCAVPALRPVTIKINKCLSRVSCLRCRRRWLSLCSQAFGNR